MPGPSVPARVLRADGVTLHPFYLQQALARRRRAAGRARPRWQRDLWFECSLAVPRPARGGIWWRIRTRLSRRG